MNRELDLARDSSSSADSDSTTGDIGKGGAVGRDNRKPACGASQASCGSAGHELVKEYVEPGAERVAYEPGTNDGEILE